MLEVESYPKVRGVAPNVFGGGLATPKTFLLVYKFLSSSHFHRHDTHLINTSTETNTYSTLTTTITTTTTTKMKTFTTLVLTIATLAAAAPSPNGEVKAAGLDTRQNIPGCVYSCACQVDGPDGPAVDPDTARCCSGVGGTIENNDTV